MKILMIIFLAVITTIPFSCEPGNKNEKKSNEFAAATDTGKTEEKLFANIHFASKMDTSCGMPLSAGVEDTLHLNDKIYGFCSRQCKEEFANKLIAEKKR